jgi:hypothetical protein
LWDKHLAGRNFYDSLFELDCRFWLVRNQLIAFCGKPLIELVRWATAFLLGVSVTLISLLTVSCWSCWFCGSH